MTVLGTQLGGAEIAALVGLLLTLVLFAMRYRGDKNYARWFKTWEAERKARRDAELARERGETPDTAPDSKRGPWG